MMASATTDLVTSTNAAFACDTTFQPEIAIARGTSSTPSACAAGLAQKTRMKMAYATTWTTASERSTPAAFATDLATIYECGCDCRHPGGTWKTATATTGTNSTPSACAAVPAGDCDATPMTTEMASATTWTTAWANSTPAASATDLATSTNAGAQTFQPEIATAMGTNSTPWACAAGLAQQTRMAMAFATTWTAALERSTHAAFATDLATSMNAGVQTFQPEIAIARGTSSTPSACAAGLAQRLDEDGICDDVDSCVGARRMWATGLARSTSGCDDIPAGDCDCDGNQLDALGVCGGIAKTPMQMASATTWTVASERSTPAAFAMALATCTNAGATTFQPETLRGKPA